MIRNSRQNTPPANSMVCHSYVYSTAAVLIVLALLMLISPFRGLQPLFRGVQPLRQPDPLIGTTTQTVLLLADCSRWDRDTRRHRRCNPVGSLKWRVALERGCRAYVRPESTSKRRFSIFSRAVSFNSSPCLLKRQMALAIKRSHSKERSESGATEIGTMLPLTEMSKSSFIIAKKFFAKGCIPFSTSAAHF